MSEIPSITELVPHEAPMLAVDELLEWVDGSGRARLVIKADAFFVRDGAVDTVVALEYMAQAVAACLGQDAYRAGAGVGVGMVIACREMVVGRPRLVVGEELILDVRRVRGADYVSQFDTRARDADGSVVATATLTLVHGQQPPD